MICHAYKREEKDVLGRDTTEKPSCAKKSWAFLFAGSSGWENYRHQVE